MTTLNPIKDFETFFFLIKEWDGIDSMYFEHMYLSTAFPCSSSIFLRSSVARVILNQSYSYWIDEDLNRNYDSVFNNRQRNG